MTRPKGHILLKRATRQKHHPAPKKLKLSGYP
jgi:hypothetical protein